MTALKAFSAQSRMFHKDECTTAWTGQQLPLGTGQWVEQTKGDNRWWLTWKVLELYGYLNYAEAANQLNDLWQVKQSQEGALFDTVLEPKRKSAYAKMKSLRGRSTQAYIQPLWDMSILKWKLW